MSPSLPTKILIYGFGFGICFFLCYFYIYLIECMVEYAGISFVLNPETFWICTVFVAGIGASAILIAATMWEFSEHKGTFDDKLIERIDKYLTHLETVSEKKHTVKKNGAEDKTDVEDKKEK